MEVRDSASLYNGNINQRRHPILNTWSPHAWAPALMCTHKHGNMHPYLHTYHIHTHTHMCVYNDCYGLFSDKIQKERRSHVICDPRTKPTDFVVFLNCIRNLWDFSKEFHITLLVFKTRFY